MLATITAVQGSSPRGVGAKMLVLADGTIVETIGGGVLEKQVIADALACLASGVSRSETLRAAARGRARPRRPLRRRGHGLPRGPRAGPHAAHRRRRPRRPEAVLPSPSCSTTWSSCSTRGRTWSAASASRRPTSSSAATRRAPPSSCPIGETTHVVIVTHGHVHDAAALRAVIDSPAAYVGMIGSANKVRTIFAQLRDDGVAAELLERASTRRSVSTSAPRRRPSWPSASWPRSSPTSTASWRRSRRARPRGSPRKPRRRERRAPAPSRPRRAAARPHQGRRRPRHRRGAAPLGARDSRSS